MSGKEILAKVISDSNKNDPGVETQQTDNWAPQGFRGRYLERDEYDTIYRIKQQIAAQAPAAGQVGQRTWEITDKEAKWHLDKVKQLELINFHNFLRESYGIDASNPVMMKWAQEMFPEYYNMREEVIDDRAETQKRLAKIRLRGPHDKDDFTLLFGIATGRVAVPNGPLWNPEGPLGGGPAARGLFNPLRGVGRPQGAVQPANRMITNRITGVNNLAGGINPANTYRGMGDQAHAAMFDAGIFGQNGARFEFNN